ncbi:4428_t:CDS:2 [Ambispora gerdemannii]|uniref:4428_t:CDS:1 n=1 Tax=Ambispora gerdemannii TaxID=144530 RepID=A0A9N9AFE5_9GLOM|nr:4428_t:CDS:2 [Ambispora gerdemannii]
MIQTNTTGTKVPHFKNFFDLKLPNSIRKAKSSSAVGPNYINSPKTEKPPMLTLPPEYLLSPDFPSPDKVQNNGLAVPASPGDSSSLVSRGSFSSINSLATTSTGVAASEVTFTLFLPLIRELKQKVEKITRRCQLAEHYRRICSALLDRALIADDAIRDFESRQHEDEFWKSRFNFLCIKRLAEAVDQIEDFIRNVSQLRRYRRFIKKNNVQFTFQHLAAEIDATLRDLNIISSDADQFQHGQDIKVVEDDSNDMSRFLQEIRGGITDPFGQVSREIEDIYTLNATYRIRKPVVPALTASAMIDVSTVDRLTPPVQPSMNVEKATWNNMNVALTKIKRQFKDEDVNGKNKIRNNVAILKRIENSMNIITFHGVIEEWDETKRMKSLFVVTEWAEFGNLREYYKNFGPLSWTRKLSIAVDVARGLNFLRAVDILHYELTTDAILITADHRAKISGCGLNFFSSENGRANSTDRISDMVDKYRYLAPEKLKSDFAYDVKCEIYSFGMLLLEIAEENLPLHGHNYKTVIEALRENTYRPQELFTRTKMAPKEYRELVLLAISHERSRRPPFSEMFLSLNAMLRRCRAAEAIIDYESLVPTPTLTTTSTSVTSSPSDCGFEGEILIGLSDELRNGLAPFEAIEDEFLI